MDSDSSTNDGPAKSAPPASPPARGSASAGEDGGRHREPPLQALMRRLKADPPPWAFATPVSTSPQPPGEATGEDPSASRQQRRIHGYRIREQIAAGAAGTLLKAVDKTLGRCVALKVFRDESVTDPARRAALEQKARAVAGLRHEHIVSVYEVGSDSAGYPFLAMEHVEGEPLDRRIRREGPLGPDEAARIAQEIALGLQAAHEAGLIHGNIKPSNIVLQWQPDRARLTDFRLTDAEHDAAEPLVEVGTPGRPFAESPAYMSPEQIERPSEVDGRSDVYSLGAVLYETLTAEKPFRGVGRMIRRQAVHDEPISPSQLNDEVPRDLETICLRALAKDPQRRYPSAAAMAEDLGRWLAREPIAAEPASPLQRAGRWYRQNRVVAYCLMGVLLLLAVITVAAVVSAVRNSRIRSGAEAALEEALRQQEAAEQSAQAAGEQRKLVVDALQDMVDKLQTELQREGIDGDEIMETGLVGLRELAEKADASGVEDIATFSAHLRLGQVLFRMRRLVAANRHIADAERLMTKLRKAAPDDDALAKLDVELRLTQGELSSALNNGFGAQLRFDESLEICKRLVEESPQDVQARKLLASALEHVGAMILIEGDGRKAHLRYVEALEIYRSLVDEHPADSEIRLAAVLACVRLGGLSDELDVPDESRQYFEEAVELAQPLEGNKAYQSVIQPLLLETHSTLGDLLADEEPQQAAQFYREMIRVAEQMLARRPGSTEALSKMSLGLAKLAEFHKQEGDFELARDQLVAQQELLTQQLAPAPEESRAAQQLAACQCDLGDVYLFLHDADAAGDSYENAINLLNRLIPGDTSRPAEGRILAEAVIGMAHVSKERNELDAIEPWLTKAEALLDELEADESGEGLLDLIDWIQQQRANIANIRETDSEGDPVTDPETGSETDTEADSDTDSEADTEADSEGDAGDNADDE